MSNLEKGADLTPRHPIGVVVDRTGLSQDVVRVWERRYGAVAPGRSAGGHRLYSDADIARLRLLQGAVRSGRSIGQVASLGTEDLIQLGAEDAASRVFPDPEADRVWEPAVEAGFALTLELDGSGLDALARRTLARAGVSSFAAQFAVPLLRRIGDGWHLGQVSIAQEHLASAVIHDVLLGIMRGAVAAPEAPRIVVATPVGERHAIGAAITGALAAADGWEVVYLGTDLPAREIASAALQAGASTVAVSVVYVQHRASVLAELTALRELLPDSMDVIAGGAGAVLMSADLTAAGLRIAPNWGPLAGQQRGPLHRGPLAG